MHFFPLEDFRDIILFLFPTLVLVTLMYIAWSRAHFHTKDSRKKEKRVTSRYPDGLESRKAPFPLVLILIIIGCFIWTVFYILGISHWGVKI